MNGLRWILDGKNQSAGLAMTDGFERHIGNWGCTNKHEGCFTQNWDFTSNQQKQGNFPDKIGVWLVVWNIFYFPIYWECHHPNWLIFFRGVQTTNQVLSYGWTMKTNYSATIDWVSSTPQWRSVKGSQGWRDRLKRRVNNNVRWFQNSILFVKDLQSFMILMGFMFIYKILQNDNDLISWLAMRAILSHGIPPASSHSKFE